MKIGKPFVTMALAMAAFLLCTLDAWGGQYVGRLLNSPLDKDRPVEVRQGNSFSYNGHVFQLDSLHFLLDATLPFDVVQDNPYLFNDFKTAVDHLADGTADSPMVLYIAPYVYWIDNPDDTTVAVGKNGREPFGMTVRCQNLHLVGLAQDASHVVLASQRGQTQGAVGNFTMFDFHGDGLQVDNLTMGNYCNVDLDYALCPALSRPKRSAAITQAHVAYCHGDRVMARNVRFISRLNMNPLNGARRILFDGCHFECTDDALTGNGVYVHCDFEFYGQKPFYTTHQAGAVMLDCDFHLMGRSSRAYFCKASGPVTLVDCRFHASNPTYVGWTAYPAPGLRCYYSHVTMNGVPYLVEQEHPETSICMDGTALLNAFKVNGKYDVCGLLAGDDGWIPDGYARLSDGQPLCTAMRIVADETTVRGGGEALKLEAQRMRHAGYAPLGRQSITWTVQEGFEKILRITPGEALCMVATDYDEDKPEDVLITATTPEGLQAAFMVRVEGKPLPAPSLKKKPKIKVKDGKAVVDYSLSPEKHEDRSVVTWLISDNKNMSHAVPIADSHDGPQRQCDLRWFHVGKWLGATVAPRHARSPLGREQVVAYPHQVKAKQVSNERVLETDFHDFPCQWQKVVKEGAWTVDGYKPADTADYPWSFDPRQPMWTYGQGFNGAVGMGLLQAQRGARLMFTPPQDCYEDMVVNLDVDPTKTAGQGFGSATGQYMDIGVKFDNHTLTGYALRIIRTTKYANAVDFMLVGYDHGQVTPLTQPVSAVCYRTGCHIQVLYRQGTLVAQVFTDTPLSQPDDPNLVTHVDLSANVAGNQYGGFYLQHTGSCGESTTMLHHLRIAW